MNTKVFKLFILRVVVEFINYKTSMSIKKKKTLSKCVNCMQKQSKLLN